MYQPGARRALQALGLSDETANQIAAISIMLGGALVMLSLLSETADGNLIGWIGSALYSGLTFVFGRFVAFIIPLLVVAWGIAFWRGYSVEKTPVRILGMFFLTLSVCTLLAIPHATTNFRLEGDNGFRAGGALGNFLVHMDALSLHRAIGTTGCYVIFLGLALVSLILLTDARIITLAAFAGRKILSFRPTAAVEWISGKLGFDGGAEPRVRRDEYTDSWGLDGGDAAPAQSGVRRIPVARPTLLEREVPIEALERAERVERAPARLVAPAPKAAAPARAVVDPDDLVSLAEHGGSVQQSLPLFAKYELPEPSMLKEASRPDSRVSRDEIEEISGDLERTLSEFGISAEVVNVTHGPTVMRFELQPAPGVKVARISSLESDLALCLKAESVRIIAPIPGKAAVGIEVPNRKRTPVLLSEIVKTDAFENHPSPLAFALGKTISGEPYLCDLATMPHLLIAGATGSGKSVCLNSVIVSILFRMTPDRVKFIMIDPKRVELNVYRDIPHLLAPVVCEARKAAHALQWAIEQMEERYKRLAELGVRNIDGYNAIVRSSKPHPKALGRNLEYMPHIVIVVDELADLMIIARNEVEDSIIRLAQMSRAVGMHLIIATQRPSVNVITGIIKANFPCRVAFQVSSKVDSRTILDMNGAESLLGRGDMLFAPAGTGKPIRIQGCFVSDQEVEAVADYARAQQKPQYLRHDFNDEEEEAALALDGVDADDSRVAQAMDDDDFDDSDAMAPWNRRPAVPARPVGVNGAAGRPINVSMPSSAGNATEEDDIDQDLFRDGARLILTHRKASVSLMQRKLKIGFARAGRLMDMMEEAGIVGPNVGSKVREILVDPEEYLAELDRQENAGF